MKTVQTASSTVGTITEYFNKEGKRERVVHTAGKAYSGKIAQQEAKKG